MARNSTSGQKKSTTTSALTPSVIACCEVLSKYEVIYDTFEKTGELIGFAPHIRFEVASAYRLIDPHYQHNDSCPACIAEMITIIYRWYKKFKGEQGI